MHGLVFLLFLPAGVLFDVTPAATRSKKKMDRSENNQARHDVVRLQAGAKQVHAARSQDGLEDPDDEPLVVSVPAPPTFVNPRQTCWCFARLVSLFSTQFVNLKVYHNCRGSKFNPVRNHDASIGIIVAALLPTTVASRTLARAPFPCLGIFSYFPLLV